MIIELGFCPDQSGQINHLPAGRGFGEGQDWCVGEGVKVGRFHASPRFLDRRAGTENVAGIVACGAALELVEQHRPATCTRLTSLRDRLIDGIEATVPGALLNGDRRRRLPNNVNFCFRDVQGETILLELEGEDVYASTGSACHAGSQDPSHVLLAIGRCPELAHTALRLTLGAPTTAAEVERVLELLPIIVDRPRERLIARRR